MPLLPRPILHLLSVCALMIGTVLGPVQASEAGPRTAPRTVLVLHSSISEARGRQELGLVLNGAIRKGAAGAIDIHSEFTGLDRFSDPGTEKLLVNLYRARYGARRVDLLLVVGPMALNFVVSNQLFPDAPVVACLVGEPVLAAARARRPNLTGALRAFSSQKTLGLMFGLFPATRRLLVVLGASGYERHLARVGRTVLEPFTGGATLEFTNDLTLEQVEARVRTLGDDGLVFFASFHQDASGRDLSADNPLARISAASRRPVFGLFEEDLGDGMVGGMLESPDNAGKAAAELALRVLGGEPAGSVPFAAAPAVAPTFDLRQLRRWGIRESRLPAGSVVRFREPGLWDTHWKQIVLVLGVILAQSLLVVSLVVQLQRRKRTERALAGAERRYRTVAEFTHDWEFWQRLDGTFEYLSPSCKRVTGYPAQAFLDDPGLMERMVAAEDLGAWRRHQAEALAGRAGGAFSYRILTGSGELRWVEQIDYPVRLPGEALAGNRGSIRDISERKLAELAMKQADDEIRALKDRLEAENTFYKAKIHSVEASKELLGQCDAMKYLLFRIQQVAPSDATVLILGETGTGKELVAEAIHRLGPRKDGPLVKVNCATLPAALAESELFGHERGAFTGAHGQRKGRFELADGATLFLDEVGELSAEVQAKLLRVLQNGEFQRVGGDRSHRVDVRVLAATNRDLGRDVAAGRFREDLWYRINVFPITVPPLRNRLEDIPELAAAFLRRLCHKLGRPEPALPHSVLRTFQAYAWPGNVRELENVIERAVLVSEPGRLTLADPLMAAEERFEARGARKGLLQDFERGQILAVLGTTQWKVEGAQGAARLLGLKPSTLRSRMATLGIERPSFDQ